MNLKAISRDALYLSGVHGEVGDNPTREEILQCLHNGELFFYAGNVVNSRNPRYRLLNFAREHRKSGFHRLAFNGNVHNQNDKGTTTLCIYEASAGFESVALELTDDEVAFVCPELFDMA